MPTVKRPMEYSNVPEEMDAEMRTPTPHEKQLEALAEENIKVPPQRYNITSKNDKAIRVIHDHGGHTVAFQPGETKLGVLLQPHVAQRLAQGDLDVVVAA